MAVGADASPPNLGPLAAAVPLVCTCCRRRRRRRGATEAPQGKGRGGKGGCFLPACPPRGRRRRRVGRRGRHSLCRVDGRGFSHQSLGGVRLPRPPRQSATEKDTGGSGGRHMRDRPQKGAVVTLWPRTDGSSTVTTAVGRRRRRRLRPRPRRRSGSCVCCATPRRCTSTGAPTTSGRRGCRKDAAGVHRGARALGGRQPRPRRSTGWRPPRDRPPRTAAGGGYWCRGKRALQRPAGARLGGGRGGRAKD